VEKNDIKRQNTYPGREKLAGKKRETGKTLRRGRGRLGEERRTEKQNEGGKLVRRKQHESKCNREVREEMTW